MGLDDAEYLLGLRDNDLTNQPAETIPLERLVIDFSPRIDGEDAEHTRTLAETLDELPPIVVHRASMTVIDGIHRLRAAALRGDDHIAVRFFDGGRADAQLLSVAANIAHGRPLSMADRTAAALRIFVSHPRWSNRSVAAVAGLSPKKVARLREGTAAARPDHRIGRDGRARPVDTSHSRELAGELLRDNPGASLRQIAEAAGLAPATVADVRDRIRRGESPVPDGRRRAVGSPGPTAAPAEPARRAGPLRQVTTGEKHGDPTALDLARLSETLRRDPSLRFSEAGRGLLRLLDACALVARDRRRIAETVPAHCKESMARLAQGYAGAWRMLADDLVRYLEEMDEAASMDECDKASSLGA